MQTFRTLGKVPFGGTLGRALRRGAGAAFAGAYDDIPDLAAVYGMRRMLTSYEDSLIRLRRSSDNAEQDIGYTSAGDLDTDAAATFIGGGSGFIVTWYDQKNSSDATQATAASQPLYVASGQNGKPVARFDGSDDYLDANGALLTQPNTALCIARKRVDDTAFMRILDGSAADANDRHSLAFSGGDITMFAGSTLTAAASIANANIYTATYDTTSSTLHTNGALGASGDAGSRNWRIVRIGQTFEPGGDHLDGDVIELVIANAAWSTANRDAAESAAADYWGVTLS